MLAGSHRNAWPDETGTGGRTNRNTQKGKVIKIKKINALKRILGNVNSDSGMMNTDSGKAARIGVHIQPEWLFTMRRNMQHLAYNDTIISSENVDNAEIIFTVIGQSFASAVEAQKRSERAKAGHAKRKAKGLPSGRQWGQKVKSRLDEHTAFILNLLYTKISKAEILRQLNERGVSISRSRFYSWLEARGLHNKKAEFQVGMFS